MSLYSSLHPQIVSRPPLGAQALLEACLAIAEATSFVAVERRLAACLPRLYADSAWNVVWLEQPAGRQLVRLQSASYEGGRQDAHLGQLVAVPLQFQGSVRGELALRFPHNQLPQTERVNELMQLGSVLANTLQRIQQELQVLTQAAELFFAHAVLLGQASPKAQPDLSRLAGRLLEQLDLSAFFIVIDPLGTGGFSWGASSRRSATPFAPDERKQLMQLAAAVTAEAHRGAQPHLLAKRQEVQTLVAEYKLPSLGSFQSLLLVPVISDGTVIGAIIAGEERQWTRQPLPRLSLSLCQTFAHTLVDALAHSHLVREVTERHQFIQTFIDGLDEAVVITQSNVIMLWNQAAAALFGYRADEVIGQLVADVLPNIPDSVMQVVKAPASRIATSKFDWHMQTIGGREIDLSCVLTQLNNLETDSPLIMFAFKKTSYEPEFAYLKDELLSIISHELRTPLNGINGFGRLLLERPYMSEAMRKEALAVLQSSIERLNRMAGDFIDVARAQRQLLPLEMDELEIAAVIRAAVRDQRHRHPERQIRLRIQKQLPMVEGDSLRIKQILDNLVSNAAKYSEPGQPITISVRQRDNAIVISVADRGSGIPKAIQQRIFESFYRGDHSRQRQVGGVGLGLSLVKSLVEAHCGTITVRSAPGKGSTFTFSLPIATRNAAPQLTAA